MTQAGWSVRVVGLARLLNHPTTRQSAILPDQTPLFFLGFALLVVLLYMLRIG